MVLLQMIITLLDPLAVNFLEDLFTFLCCSSDDAGRSSKLSKPFLRLFSDSLSIVMCLHLKRTNLELTAIELRLVLWTKSEHSRIACFFLILEVVKTFVNLPSLLSDFDSIMVSFKPSHWDYVASKGCEGWSLSFQANMVLTIYLHNRNAFFSQAEFFTKKLN